MEIGFSAAKVININTPVKKTSGSRLKKRSAKPILRVNFRKPSIFSRHRNTILGIIVGISASIAMIGVTISSLRSQQEVSDARIQKLMDAEKKKCFTGKNPPTSEGEMKAYTNQIMECLGIIEKKFEKRRGFLPRL